MTPQDSYLKQDPDSFFEDFEDHITIEFDTNFAVPITRISRPRLSCKLNEIFKREVGSSPLPSMISSKSRVTKYIVNFSKNNNFTRNPFHKSGTFIRSPNSLSPRGDHYNSKN